MKQVWKPHPLRKPRLTRLILPGLLLAAIMGGCVSNQDPGGEADVLRHNPYRPGIYEGAGRGYRGPVHLMVEVDSGNILNIEILDHGDDPLVGGAAMEELMELVLDSNSPELDAVSGATESSAGFLAAVEDALTKAKARD
jgi:fumarate reductase flavoprotein subunit